MSTEGWIGGQNVVAEVVVVQLLSCVELFATPGTAAHQALLYVTICQSFLKFMSIESVMLSNYLILCYPLLFLSSVFPSLRVFFPGSAEWVSSLHQVVRVLEFQHQSFQWILGLISFRIDWFDLLAAQGTLESLLQYHGSKVLILQCSVFFMSSLTSIHDSWKNHNFDYSEICRQSDAFAF